MERLMEDTTGCFIVKEIMEGFAARNRPGDFKNTHLCGLGRHPVDVVIFGDKDKSIDINKKPILFDKNLAERLTLNSKNNKIKFKEGFSGLLWISSSIRAFRELTDESTDFLLESV